MNRIFYLCCLLICSKAFYLAIVESASAQQLPNVEPCIETLSRIERLDCFDRIFNVKNDVISSHETPDYPLAWTRAMKVNEVHGRDLILVTEGEGLESNAWIALPALNSTTSFTDNAKPVLMLSCIDNLSRIEIALPSSVEGARVKVTLSNQTSQIWRSDDTGLLMSSARGLPAINLMKGIINERQLIMRSNAPFIDGLIFNTEQLSTSIEALRQRCGW